MKASKFSEAQIAFVLKQAEDGSAVAEVCRKAGISEVRRDNQDENPATIRMRMRRCWGDEGRA